MLVAWSAAGGRTQFVRADIKRFYGIGTRASCMAAIAMIAVAGCASQRAVSCKGRLEPINAPAASAARASATQPDLVTRRHFP